MPISVNSTQTKLRDGHVMQVREILDAYEFRGIEARLSENGASWFLQIEDDHDPEWEPVWIEDDDPEMWQVAEAIRRERLPNKQQFADEKAWGEALDAMFRKEGIDGFRALLGELSDHLETPLVVLELYRESDGLGQACAEALIVRPGQGNVESVVVSL